MFPESIAQFGFAAVMCVAVFVSAVKGFLFLHAEHKQERGEWRESSARQNDKIIVALDKLERVIKKTGD